MLSANRKSGRLQSGETSRVAGGLCSGNYALLLPAAAGAAFILLRIAGAFARDFFAAAFPGADAAARFAAHRFFRAATIARLPAADNLRFGFFAGGGGAVG